MLIKIITIGFDPLTHQFDDAELLEFIKDKKILSLRDHFFTKNSGPYIAIIVTYELHEMVIPEPANQKSKDENWRDLLDEKDIPLFNTMREWRKERCKQEGVPPYIICTNKQLAIIVKKRPNSLEKLSEIEGIGKGKLEKYGRDILDRLKESDLNEE